jgi:hypothetical protein
MIDLIHESGKEIIKEKRNPCPIEMISLSHKFLKKYQK